MLILLLLLCVNKLDHYEKYISNDVIFIQINKKTSDINLATNIYSWLYVSLYLVVIRKYNSPALTLVITEQS